MTDDSRPDGPLVEIVDLEKRYDGPRLLRIDRLTVGRGDRLALSGLDAAAAELFMHLVTGAAVPDQGTVRIAGRSTVEIATDTEWLASLDRFGMVTERAVLLESLTVASNMALPFTLAIDPMPDDVRVKVDALAEDVGLGAGRLTAAVSTLSPAERVRLHLARALAVGPDVVLLEHPTARLDADAAHALGQTLSAVSARRRLAWVALTDDEGFARASGGTRLRLDPRTGRLFETGGFWRKLISGLSG